MNSMRRISVAILSGLALPLLLGGCASEFRREPPPPGSVAERLEHAGAKYQATEAAPTYRDERPNESRSPTR
jgi:hypothetical protein